MKLILKAVSQKYGSMFDGLECDDAVFCDYVNRKFDKFPECVTGGYMRFEYNKKLETLYVITEYETRKLTKEEEQQVIDYTQGQWSDGIGEGFEQQPFSGEEQWNDPNPENFNKDVVYNPSPWHNGQKVTLSYEGEDPDPYNTCRVCGDHLPEGMGRSNDYLSMNIMPREYQDKYADTIQQPICAYCEDEKPDEYHKEFMRKFYKK